MLAKQLMQRNVGCVRLDDDASAAARIMWEQDCGVVPVVDARQRVVGVVTDRDLCIAAYRREARLAEIAIADVMTREPTTCGEDDGIETVEALMAEAHVRRLPVVSIDGVLRGILSITDLAAARAGLHDAAHPLDDVTTTLAAIGNARHVGPRG